MIRRTVPAAGAVSAGPDPYCAPNGATMRPMPGGAAGWTPTVAHLFVLVVLEIVIFGVIRYAFRRIMD